MKKKIVTQLAAGAAMTLGLGLALAMPAQADHGGGGDSNSGNCSMRSMWELKAEGDNSGRHFHHGGDNRIEVEFKIRANHDSRNVWNWMVSDNGTVVRDGSGRANDELERRFNIPNLDGSDAVVLNATNTMTGETCDGQVVVRGGHRH